MFQISEASPPSDKLRQLKLVSKVLTSSRAWLTLRSSLKLFLNYSQHQQPNSHNKVSNAVTLSKLPSKLVRGPVITKLIILVSANYNYTSQMQCVCISCCNQTSQTCKWRWTWLFGAVHDLGYTWTSPRPNRSLSPKSDNHWNNFDKNIEQISSFKYLRTIVNSLCNPKQETRSRIE